MSEELKSKFEKVSEEESKATIEVALPNDNNQFSLTKERLIELGFEEINGLLWYEFFPFGLAYIDDEESPIIGDDYLEPYWGVWCANALLSLRLRNEAHLRDLFIAHRVVPPKGAKWKSNHILQSGEYVKVDTVIAELKNNINIYKSQSEQETDEVLKNVAYLCAMDLQSIVQILTTLKNKQ